LIHIILLLLVTFISENKYGDNDERLETDGAQISADAYTCPKMHCTLSQQ